METIKLNVSSQGRQKADVFADIIKTSKVKEGIFYFSNEEGSEFDSYSKKVICSAILERIKCKRDTAMCLLKCICDSSIPSITEFQIGLDNGGSNVYGLYPFFGFGFKNGMYMDFTPQLERQEVLAFPEDEYVGTSDYEKLKKIFLPLAKLGFSTDGWRYDAGVEAYIR